MRLYAYTEENLGDLWCLSTRKLLRCFGAHCRRREACSRRRGVHSDELVHMALDLNEGIFLPHGGEQRAERGLIGINCGLRMRWADHGWEEFWYIGEWEIWDGGGEVGRDGERLLGERMVMNTHDYTRPANGRRRAEISKKDKVVED